MKVSIIMPAYNVGDYIEESIASVLEQTYSNWELIIIDDSSSDNTKTVVRHFVDCDSRIKLISNIDNYGAGRSRNVGLENASGRFVAFLDADDVWEKEKLEIQIRCMEEYGATISHTDYSYVDKAGIKVPGYVKVRSRVDLKTHLCNTEIGTSTAVIDTSKLISKLSFSEIRARQDLQLWINLLSQGYESVGINIPLVRYRVRQGSVSSNKLKMLYVTFEIYMKIKTLPLYLRVCYYISYVCNAIKKRLVSVG